MTTRKIEFMCAGALALAATACNAAAPADAQQDEAARASLFAAAPEAQWRLPDRLAEISGMTTTADGRVLAHDDEVAIIYELDAEHGRLVKAFALGDGRLRDDFEGLAATPTGDLFMVTSTGALYAFREGEDGARVGYETFDTGLEQICEIEGLAYQPAQESLILACKTNHVSDLEDVVALFAWSPAHPDEPARPWLTVSRAALRAAGAPRLHPSAVEIDPESGRVIVLAAAERMLVELSPEGDVASARLLAEGHNQAEGMAILPDGALLIGDEAERGGRAKLTRYGRRS